MSVGSAENRVSHDGNGSTVTPYQIPYRYDDPDWLIVTVTDAAGAVTTLTRGVDFFLTGDGKASAGELRTATSLPDSSTLVIARYAAAEQNLVLVPNAPLDAKVLEGALDSVVMALQDRDVSPGIAGSRALMFPVAEPDNSPNILPVAGLRKDSVPYFGKDTGTLQVLSLENLAPRILAYWGTLGITSTDVLAAISAMAPLIRFTPPTTDTLGLFGQLAIIPEHVTLNIGGTLTPDITGQVLPWKIENGKIWHSTGGVDPATLIGTPLSASVEWTGSSFVVRVYEYGQLPNPQKAWASFPGSQNNWPYPDHVTTWLPANVSGAPSITISETIAARVWVNLAQTGAAPDWQEIPNQEANDIRYGLEWVHRATNNQAVTNSATLTDSLALQKALGVGTYEIETLELLGSSAYASAGAKSRLTFTGTGTFTGYVARGNAAATTPINVAPTWGGPDNAVNSLIGGTGSSWIITRNGNLVVTAPGTLKVQFAQAAAVARNRGTLPHSWG